ncbi:efflux transporter outer membrane subunit [Sphingobium yanoikuyae]|nr:efflux transporter outer membrane subunit [Sphingobium yanoikuyae]
MIMTGRNITKRKSAAGAAGAMAVMLSACTVGPDYREPRPLTPSSWAAPRPGDSDAGSLTSWWDRFDDPTLTLLQQLADASSPTLAQAVARIDQARATLTSRRAEGRPSVTGSASYTHSEQRLGTGEQSITINNDGVQAGGDASWQIDLFGKVRRNTRAARARVEAREGDRDAARVSLAAEVADTYIQYRGCEQLSALYRQQAQSQGETARLTRISANAGFIAPADAELTEASAASVSSSLTDQTAQCDLLVKSLTSLSGLEEAALREMLAPRAGVLPEPTAFEVAAVPADVLRQRPDIASSERELAAASEEIGVAVADLYPSLSLGGSLSTGSGARSWSFGPSLSLPIFDGGRAKAGVRSARAAYALQLATWQEAARAAVLEIEQALVRLDAARARQADAARAAQGYQANFAAIERLRVAGSTSMIERESARRNALDAQRTLVDLRIAQARYWVALYKAVGGGWNADITFVPSANGALVREN